MTDFLALLGIFAGCLAIPFVFGGIILGLPWAVAVGIVFGLWGLWAASEVDG